MTPERFRRLQQILARRQSDLTVLMDQVHKPHNFAAVVRTCDAVGVGRVHIVPAEGYEPHDRTAMGAARYVEVLEHVSLDAAVEAVKGPANGAPIGEGVSVVAAHPGDDCVDFRMLDYTRPTALLLGTELEGVSEAGLAAADHRVAIPMRGAVSSLNVSVAAAIILYEAERQRAAAGAYDRPLPADEATRRTLFEWAYPRIADLCRRRGVPYPDLDEEGEILGELPR